MADEKDPDKRYRLERHADPARRRTAIQRALEAADVEPQPRRRGLSELLAADRGTHKLEAEFLDKAITWLEEKWVDRRCPFCHKTSWGVSIPVELLTAGDPMSPAFPVMCDNCGLTVFVNAIVAGVVEDE